MAIKITGTDTKLLLRFCDKKLSYVDSFKLFSDHRCKGRLANRFFHEESQTDVPSEHIHPLPKDVT